MINLKIIYKIIGQLLYIEAFLMAVCVAMAFAYGETDSMGFLFSTIITVGAALIFRYLGLNANNSLGRRDAYLLVTLVWVVFSFFGALPFYITGYLPHFTDAYFETMSGFSTTGASVIDNVERLPHALKFWRSLTQWIGGLGIVFFTIAILPSFVGGSVKVFAAEATGPMRSRLHPRLSTNAKWIWSIYLLLTVACATCYYVGGAHFFDSVNYAMCTTATGGFSPHNDSAEFFHSPFIEYICILFCFLSSINFTLLYLAVIKRRPGNLFKSTEFKFFLIIVASFTLFIMAELIMRNHYELEKAFRVALFQVVSFISTTGLFNDDAAKWPHITWVLLAVCMFIGGCAGSTAGGFKCIRGVMLIKVVRNQFKQLLHPNAVLPLKIDGQNVEQQKRVTLLAFLTVYLLICLVMSFVLIAAGIDSTNSITIILSCIGNVGPTLGIEIGPTMSWAELPVFVKWICSFVMLVGRLEIFSVLIIFTPQFWTK